VNPAGRDADAAGEELAMTPATDREKNADRAFCADLLPDVSRTFALSIAGLPGRMRAPIEAAYLMCRIADTIEDDHRLARDVREQLFDAFDDALANERSGAALDRLAVASDLGQGTESQRLCAGARRVFRCFHALPLSQRSAIRPHVAELARGMRELGRERPFHEVADLERYCYFVAGTVGKLLTAVFELEVPDLDESARRFVRARAVAFGIGLQLVNIVKDVGVDFERGDCFLPADLAARHGVPLAEVLETRHRPAALGVVRDVCTIARARLRHARDYTLAWPADAAYEVRVFCAVPLALAFATLVEIENGNGVLLRGKTPKVARTLVVRVFADVRRTARSDEELGAILDKLEEGAA
jgi:farnesyl-diphosphate farnesyltransferase